MNVCRTQNQRADGLIEGQGETVMSVVFFFSSLTWKHVNRQKVKIDNNEMLSKKKKKEAGREYSWTL